MCLGPRGFEAAHNQISDAFYIGYISLFKCNLSCYFMVDEDYEV